MSRRIRPKAKLVRTFGENIYGAKKYDKILARKPGHPGMHGKKMRRRLSAYGQQLKEKQKLRAIYDVGERQFRHYYAAARKTQAATGEKLLQILESRLDNIIFRAGFSTTRSMARQLVGHGHVLLDGKRNSIPSCLVRPGQVVSLSASAQKIQDVAKLLGNKELTVPVWLKRQAVAAKVERLPKREEIDVNIAEQLIVEFYSR